MARCCWRSTSTPASGWRSRWCRAAGGPRRSCAAGGLDSRCKRPSVAIQTNMWHAELLLCGTGGGSSSCVADGGVLTSDCANICSDVMMLASQHLQMGCALQRQLLSDHVRRWQGAGSAVSQVLVDCSSLQGAAEPPEAGGPPAHHRNPGGVPDQVPSEAPVAVLASGLVRHMGADGQPRAC
jgi:hypothetical protein